MKAKVKVCNHEGRSQGLHLCWQESRSTPMLAGIKIYSSEGRNQSLHLWRHGSRSTPMKAGVNVYSNEDMSQGLQLWRQESWSTPMLARVRSYRFWTVVSRSVLDIWLRVGTWNITHNVNHSRSQQLMQIKVMSTIVTDCGVLVNTKQKQRKTKQLRSFNQSWR